jgi:transposase
MPRGHPRDPRKELFWRDHLARWQRSGLSVRAYCAQHHLAAPSFYAWRRTLAQRQPAAPAAATVTLLPLALPSQAPAPQPLLEVVLRNGRCLRLVPGVSLGVVRDLLAVLEETPC